MSTRFSPLLDTPPRRKYISVHRSQLNNSPPEGSLSTAKSDLAPYGNAQIYLMGLFLGIFGTTVVVVVNAWRMGQLKRVKWIVAVAVLLGLIFSVSVDFSGGLLASVVAIIFTIAVVEWQKPFYNAWLQTHGNQIPTWTQRGGWPWFLWLVGIVIGITIIWARGLEMLHYFLGPLLSGSSSTSALLLTAVGCFVTILMPAAFDLFGRKPMHLQQMWFYTVGWLGSFLFTGFWIFAGLLSSDGWTHTYSLRNIQIQILTMSSMAYIPVVVLALIGGWLAFRFKHFSLARIFMLLPLVDAAIYVIMFLGLS